MRQQPAQRGFTLIEMVAVVVIIALVASMAIPRFGNSLVRARADAAARRVAADLELSRKQALIKGSPRTVTFNATTDAYTLAGVAHIDHPTQSYIVQLSEIPYEVDLQAASFGAGSEVTFDAFGIPDNGGTVTVTAGADTRVVTVDAVTGETSISGG